MNPYRKAAVAVAIFLELALPGCNKSSSPFAPAVPAIPVPVGPSLFGQVTVAATAAPLEGARIEVTEVMSDITHRTSSDANGLFRVSGLRSGFSHLVTVSRDGFERTEKRVTLTAPDLDVRQDFQLVELAVASPVQISGEWRGTISNRKDPMDDPSPCPETEQIAGRMEQSGGTVSANFSGTCNRVQFEGFIEGGSLAGKITLIFPQDETFTGSASGMASPSRIQLSATLRSGGHTIPGFEIVLTR